jgi:N-acetylmuramoyl-L-alanine amidase
MTDQELLAYCGWQEDRGEGVGGCYDVMHVVMNRVKSPDFPNTVHDVVYERNAFSWTRPTDPQYGKYPLPNDVIYGAAFEAARYVLAGDSDPTGGALYYANLKTIDAGGWFARNILGHSDTHPVTMRINKLTFFK